MSYEGNPGTNALAKVLSNRMQKENSSSLVLDFGSIGGDYSLVTNTFPLPIPKSDYTVCRHIAGLFFTIDIGGEHIEHLPRTGVHDHDIHVPLIKPGDRVLVAWVQNEAVVVDVILPASKMGKVVAE